MIVSSIRVIHRIMLSTEMVRMTEYPEHSYTKASAYFEPQCRVAVTFTLWHTASQYDITLSDTAMLTEANNYNILNAFPLSMCGVVWSQSELII